MRQEQVQEAYEYCRRVTQRASKTFYWGSVFLPQPKRQAVWAVYALCRTVDDIVDETTPANTPRVGHLGGSRSPSQELAYWRSSLERLYETGSPGDHPIQRAWSDLLTCYHVPLQPLLDLLDGVEMDLTKQRYQTFDELYLYCYRVAGTVGLLTCSIFGYQDEAALTHAVELGIALQLTNILRDIGEDARRDRIYLPQEEMNQFGYREEDLLTGVVNEAFRELIRFQIARAEEYYRRSHPGIALLNADCRLAVKLSATLYSLILEHIRLNDYNVFTKRASVPLQRKLATASHHWFQQQLDLRFKRPQGA